jgi:hypothetical protein
MNETQMVNLIAYRLGNVKGQDDAIKAELAQSIRRVEDNGFHPWFLVSENNFYETQVGESRIPIPAGFIMEYEEGSLALQGDEGVPRILGKKSMDVISECSYSGEPLYYALTNKYFRLYPVPDAVYKLELIFYRRSTALGYAEGENPWYDEASELLVAETCWAMLAARKSKDAEYWRNLANQQWLLIQQKDAERRESNREITFGGD